ncbi:MAG: hypothetical protein CMC08_06585 [Flavobacteriaceae bacterium]|nr:hypothetical protein [Flavobacteriaceae bacterium]
MESYSTTWKRPELSAYILLYCAHANYIESPSEKELIRAKVSRSKYKTIHEEFARDNDYQCIRKIQETVARLGLSPTEIESLIEEMRALFYSDGGFDAVEKAVFLGLRHILESEKE